MSDLKTKRKRSADLKVGDSIAFCGKLYRVTGFEPYEGPLADIIDRIAHVEGHGKFMSIERRGWIEVAA